MLRRLILIVTWTLLACAPLAGRAQDPFETLAARLADGDFADRARVVAEIAASGDPRAATLLERLADGDLAVMKAGSEHAGRLVRVEARGRDDVAFDLFTGEALGEIGRRGASKIRVNNALRRDVAAALGALRLRAPEPAARLAAARAVRDAADPAMLAALEAALVAEADAAVRAALETARAATVLASARPEAEKIAALEALAGAGGAEALTLVIAAERMAATPALAEAATAARARLERAQALWAAARDLWFGLSAGSVLLLAALGLAITFGVMGVINMAHGELVMLGAYATFAVQQGMRALAPELTEWTLAVALPVAFLTAGAVGVAIERGVVRWLYGRPLETLLATWGVSLILQQAVRSIFGPTNREVANPDWMSGAFRLGELTITWNRFWIALFALVVFAGLLLLLKRTPLGLRMRAVTQNRAMAESMGVRSGRVDALTFGLGAGVAGLAGVALSQIDNVSPNLGQGYIVDSFMVVVFGGVGNLWGALAGALTLGVANKLLEPWAGAVLGKILVLVFLILFIQKRPRGLFALRGRAVEA